jgi:hypothetical protein
MSLTTRHKTTLRDSVLCQLRWHSCDIELSGLPDFDGMETAERWHGPFRILLSRQLPISA